MFLTRKESNSECHILHKLLSYSKSLLLIMFYDQAYTLTLLQTLLVLLHLDLRPEALFHCYYWWQALHYDTVQAQLLNLWTLCPNLFSSSLLVFNLSSEHEASPQHSQSKESHSECSYRQVVSSCLRCCLPKTSNIQEQFS